MDYVAADGSPAGFNTALLAELSRRMGKNIELVVVDSAGRAAALASGNVDAVFWTRTNSASNDYAAVSEEERARFREESEEKMSDEEIRIMRSLKEMIDFPAYGCIDMPEGTIMTEPWFSDIIVPVVTQTHMEHVAARANK